MPQQPTTRHKSAQAAALSNVASSSVTRATVTGSVSSPPKLRDVNIRKSPASRMAPRTGRASREGLITTQTGRSLIRLACA
jgi:hypothetical protein